MEREKGDHLCRHSWLERPTHCAVMEALARPMGSCAMRPQQVLCAMPPKLCWPWGVLFDVRAHAKILMELDVFPTASAMNEKHSRCHSNKCSNRLIRRERCPAAFVSIQTFVALKFQEFAPVTPSRRMRHMRAGVTVAPTTRCMTSSRD